MEQGNRLDSTPVSTAQAVRDDGRADRTLDAAITTLLTEPSGEAIRPSAGLVGMVAEWQRLLHLENHGGLSDEEADPIVWERVALHSRICDFPVASLADLVAKLPLFRDEVVSSVPSNADKPTMDYMSWCSIVRDLEAVGAMPAPEVGGASTPNRASNVDENGFVNYEDAAGHVQHRPVAEWIAHTATRLNRVAREELNRAFNAACRDEPDQDANVLHDRLRKELRIDALHDLAARSDQVFAVSREYAVGHRWRIVGEDADAELLALGREFDAIHAEWVPAAIAQGQAEAKALALSEDLKDRRGWTVMEAYEASWAEPGLVEVVDLGDAVTSRLDQVQNSILALPARTLDGLAVKARAAIPAFWSRGKYEQDAGLGDNEDWTERNARSLIDECLHLAGMDWTGRRWRDAPAEPTTEQPPDPSRLTPKESANGVDLSGLGINELCILYETTGAAREVWGGAMCLPVAVAKTSLPHGFVTHTPFGALASSEDSRLALLRDRVATEAERRTPGNHWDRNDLLALRIRHELACEGRICSPALLADIAQTWAPASSESSIGVSQR